jgi:hypothetical protein
MSGTGVALVAPVPTENSVLQELTLRLTMDAPWGGGVGAVIRKANMCAVT